MSNHLPMHLLDLLAAHVHHLQSPLSTFQHEHRLRAQMVYLCQPQPQHSSSWIDTKWVCLVWGNVALLPSLPARLHSAMYHVRRAYNAWSIHLDYNQQICPGSSPNRSEPIENAHRWPWICTNSNSPMDTVDTDVFLFPSSRKMRAMRVGNVCAKGTYVKTSHEKANAKGTTTISLCRNLAFWNGWLDHLVPLNRRSYCCSRDPSNVSPAWACRTHIDGWYIPYAWND